MRRSGRVVFILWLFNKADRSARRMKLTSLIASTLLINPLAGFAANLKGVRFPDRQLLDGRTLRLNGVASLEKTIFHIDVLAAGLYLESPAGENTDVVNSNGLKQLVLVFLRNVSAKQLAGAWKDGFDENCGRRCQMLQPEFQLLSSLLKDVKRGQEVRLTFFPDAMEIQSQGLNQVLQGRRFSETVLATFVGPRAGDQNIKRGLLSSGHPAEG
jgi:hypothetical protein